MMAFRSNGSRRVRRGVIVPFIAISLVALLGVAALAIDGGMLYVNRRKVQAAADAAALAGAIGLYNGSNNNTSKTSATATATDNGYTDGTDNVTVNVNVPPSSGPYASTTGFCEVIITMQQPRFFSSLIGAGNVTVTGRAVARGDKSNPGIGLLILNGLGRPSTNNPDSVNYNSSASNALLLSSSGGITVNNGTVVVDSINSSGLSLSSTGSITANSGVDLAGNGYATSGPSSTVNGNRSPQLGSPPTIDLNQTQTPDPYAQFAHDNLPTAAAAQSIGNYGSNRTIGFVFGTGPSPTPNTKVAVGGVTPTFNNAFSATGANATTNIMYVWDGNKNPAAGTPTNITMNPGYYAGLTINLGSSAGSSSNPIVNVVWSTGVYFMDGNVTFQQTGQLISGGGGTLWFQNSGAVTNSSQTFDVTLSPMTSGTYSNPPLAFWQKQGDTSQFNFSAGGNLIINGGGIIYIPTALFRLSGRAGVATALGSQVVVNTMALTASGSFTINANGGGSGGPGTLYLVE